MGNSWIILIIALGFICYFLYKRGKFREEKETIYKKSMKCPFDGSFCAVEGRSIQKDYVTKVCSRCSSYEITRYEISN